MKKTWSVFVIFSKKSFALPVDFTWMKWPVNEKTKTDFIFTIKIICVMFYFRRGIK